MVAWPAEGAAVAVQGEINLLIPRLVGGALTAASNPCVAVGGLVDEAFAA